MGEGFQVEIIAYAPTAFYHCQHCEIVWRELGATTESHQEQVENSLPPDLARSYQEISDWVINIFNKYGDRLIVKVVDAASIEGFMKSLRYGAHRYPAIIVNGKKLPDQDHLLEAAQAEITRLLG